MTQQQEFHFDYGVTREQACIMCHLSADCSGCCLKCIAEGKKCGNSMQLCSQPSREHDGQRFEAWMYILSHDSFKHLLKYLPRKYRKYVKL